MSAGKESVEPGRRDYDRQIDPLIEMYVEERLRETRHELRNDIATLATNQAASALQATKEHGEVRSEIQGVRNDVAALRRDLTDVLPLRDTVADLKHRDDMEEARQVTAVEVLAEVRKNRIQTRNFMVAVTGVVVSLLVGTAGVLVVVL
jgi:hypothetical protein